MEVFMKASRRSLTSTGRLAAALAFVLQMGLTHSLVADAPSPPPATSDLRFEAQIRAFEAQDKTNPPPQGAVLFIGSSSIGRWKTLAKDFPGIKVINRGINSTEISDWVAYTGRLVIPYRPRLIVLGAGTNDIHNGKTPEQVLTDFQAFVGNVRAALPDTRIAFLGINPAPSRWAEREKQQEANRLIKSDIAAQRNMVYIELWGVELGADGSPREDLFVTDRLHPSPAGYKVRADVVRAYLK